MRKHTFSPLLWVGGIHTCIESCTSRYHPKLVRGVLGGSTLGELFKTRTLHGMRCSLDIDGPAMGVKYSHRSGRCARLHLDCGLAWTA
eukprot:6355078-Amphidinium_carterae.1